MLTESHLEEDIKDAEVKISGFDLCRTDRVNFKNGGIVIYIRSDLGLGVRPLLSLSHNKIEVMVLECVKINCILVCVYRPPIADSGSFSHVLHAIKNEIEKNGGVRRTILMGGDFNFPIIDWKTRRVSGGTMDQMKQAKDLLEFTDNFFMDQYIKKPTRNQNILDLFFTNNDEIMIAVEVEAPTILSDHNLQIITTGFFPNLCDEIKPPKDESFYALNFHDNTINWEQINDCISNVDWMEKFKNKSTTGMYEAIHETLLEICKKNVPEKRNTPKNNIPRDRRILMRKRSKLKKQVLNKTGHQQDTCQAELRNIELQLLKSHEEEEKRNEEIAVSKIRLCPKYFYKYARSRCEVKSGIGPFIINNKVIAEGKAKSDVLQSQYISVYSTTGYKLANVKEKLNGIPGPQSLNEVIVTEGNIEKAIDDINASSAGGKDGIPALLLKNCKTAIKTPLTLMWKKSFETGEIPPLLKFGCIIPIHKGGDKSVPANYRPVTLTSHVIKIAEKLVAKHIIEYLETADLFNCHQHGFRKNRSCLSQLLEHYQLILQEMEMGNEVSVIYLDFSKAFDKVDHMILLEKLLAIGVTGKLFDWICAFLLERRQTVLVDGKESEVENPSSGVPQGSVLGPLLFLIHISDIDMNLEYTSASSFADDTRVMARESESSQVTVQRELSLIYEWALQNNMKFNETKFEHLQYRVKQELQHDWTYFAADGQPIVKPSEVKDLGVIMDSEASFDLHIEKMVSKARGQAGWVL